MKTINVCKYCGSPSVCFDAVIDANTEEVVNIYDSVYCGNCDAQAKYCASAEVPDDFDMQNGIAPGWEGAS
jgi:hypothetical protein